MLASYVSADQLIVAGDQTAEFLAGRRIRANCGVDGYVYSTIQSSSYSSPNTTVTIEDSELTSNLLEVHYGIVSQGSTGSLPVHKHDETEGQGGFLGVRWYDNASYIDPGSTSYILDENTGNVYSFFKSLNNTSKIIYTIDSSKVLGSLTNFQVQLNLSTSVGTSSTDVSNIFTVLGENKKKLRVIDQNEDECYVEIVYWDPGNNEAVLFVTVPSVSSVEDTVITLEYNPDWDDNGTYVGVTGSSVAQSLYDTADKAVFHMSTEPTSGVATVLDSSPTATNATPYSMSVANLVDADVGKGLNFDGSSAYILSNNSDVGSYDFATISVRCYNRQGKLSTYRIATVFGRSAGSDSNDIMVGFNGNNELEVYDSEVGGSGWSSSGTYQNVWTQIDFIYRKGLSVSTYVNGSHLNTHSINQTWNTGNLPIGDAQYSYDEFFNGIISDFRIMSEEKTSDWIFTNSHSMADTLCSVSFLPAGDINTLLGSLKPSFIDLTDTPSTYSGTENMYLQSTGSGTRWVEASASSVESFLDLSDTPATYEVGKYLVSTVSGIAWATVSGSDSVFFGSGYPAISASVNSVYFDTSSGDIYRKVRESGTIIEEDVCVGGTATSDSLYNPPSNLAQDAFDDSLFSLWHSDYTTYPIYIQYQFTEAQPIGKLRMYPLASFPDRMPKDFTLKASNTGEFSGEEIDVVSYSNQTYSVGQWKEFIFDPAGAFLYYRIHITGSNDSYQNIVEIEMMAVDVSGWELKYELKNSFLDLSDTPTTYSGTENMYLQSTGSGTQWAEIPTSSGSGANTFLELTDTPTTYSGTENLYLQSTGIGTQWAEVSSSSVEDVVAIAKRMALIFGK